MEWPVVIVALGSYFPLGVVLWRQQRIIERQAELLAARSYGEYASGQVRIEKAKRQDEPTPFDPGF